MFSLDARNRMAGGATVGYTIVHADCMEWLMEREPDSVHAIVTDPPYGLREYSPENLLKMQNGSGGVWRIPPSFDGHRRNPQPRFTDLRPNEIEELKCFFSRWAKLAYRVLTPGAHVFLACTVLWHPMIVETIREAGFEYRGTIVRLVSTMRGGDRPKGAHEEFEEVSTIPRSAWEPWALFRKPISEATVAENLRKWGTGALRRPNPQTPFWDVIPSERTPKCEREIAPHPSLKPQRFLRQIVWASLPLGRGIVLDPFMGSGSTLAAALAVGYESIGIEINEHYVRMAESAIPKLAAIKVTGSLTTRQVSLFGSSP